MALERRRETSKRPTPRRRHRLFVSARSSWTQSESGVTLSTENYVLFGCARCCCCQRECINGGNCTFIGITMRPATHHSCKYLCFFDNRLLFESMKHTGHAFSRSVCSTTDLPFSVFCVFYTINKLQYATSRKLFPSFVLYIPRSPFLKNFSWRKWNFIGALTESSYDDFDTDRLVGCFIRDIRKYLINVKREIIGERNNSEQVQRTTNKSANISFRAAPGRVCFHNVCTSRFLLPWMHPSGNTTSSTYSILWRVRSMYMVRVKSIFAFNRTSRNSRMLHRVCGTAVLRALARWPLTLVI